MDEVAEVWVTIPDHLVAKRVLDTTNLTVVEYNTPSGVLEEVMMSGFRDAYFKGEGDDWGLFLTLLKDHCHALLSNNTFFTQIRDIRPDFIIVDNIPNLKMMAVLAYRLGVPFAFVGSAYDPIQFRTPFSPAIAPVPLFPFTHRMTFAQRMQNSLIFLLSSLHDYSSYSDAVSRYAPEMPDVPLDLLVARAELWLVEMDHVLDYPRSTLPNVKLIGGTATGPAKPVPPPFKAFMDGASQGVVIVSFGSYILDLPKAVSDKIFTVLMQLPMKSVFRSNLTSPDPNKIMTSTWIPQNDLLGHKNTKVFVSHCGKNGQYEALFHAVPVVAAPVFADQGYNAQRMRSKGFAETVDIRTITGDDLKATILKVATEKSYKDAISKASEIFRIEFGVPMERAAFWLDHVMKYGGAYMRSAGQEMPFYQFICLDVILCYIGVLAVVCSLVGTCAYKGLKFIFRSQKHKTE
ncbi:UDP-glucuronosyltransferase 2A3-like isoform X2 [Littorina saxatilis]|uniref:UDP-glucuronosyltransferase 2A3-like isoform X2 n=1 Tax=Littorina saxatilis TaxID=31220 RepID=UPI0038B44354